MEKTYSIKYQEYEHWNELGDGDQILIKKAREICITAYAPYSKFQVGASLLLSDGTIVKGSNQENIAYPSGLCAERVALFYAGSNYPNEAVDTLCIVAKGDLLPFDKILTPCGACRQVMAETQLRQEKDYRVILVCQNDVTVVFDSANDLLPLSFGT